MSLTYNQSYVAQGLARLLEQYKGQPRITALITAWLAQCQEVEDALWSVWLDRELQSGLATGDLLDKLGALVGQVREGVSDAIYALLISARIQANRSDGKRPTLIKIASLLAPGFVVGTREYIGAVVMTIYGPLVVPPAVLSQQFLQVAQLAGVRMTLVYTLEPMASTLLFGYSGVVGLPVQPTAAQSPGYYGAGPSSGYYIEGGLAAGAMTADGGSAS